MILSFAINVALAQEKTNGTVTFAGVSMSVDSLLTTYSIDELVSIKEHFREETDRLLQEKEELRQRGIKDMESFVQGHPNSPMLDKIIIRLAELRYEQALYVYEEANDEYSRLLTLYDEGKITEEPVEPRKNYTRSLTLYQQIIDEFPHSGLVDDAVYNKGFLIEDLGRYEEAFEIYHTLIDSFPESHYVPDALMRMAEYYFNPPMNDVAQAIRLYKQVLNYKGSARYDAALYRLGWAYYKLSDYPSSISYFTLLADDIERNKDRDPEAKYHFPSVRDEAVEYIGISFLDYGGPANAAKYFDEIGGRDYGFEVLKKIGDVYMDVKEEYDKAIDAYQLILSMYPNSPQAPKIQAKIAEAYRNIEDERLAYVRRAELYNKYREGSEWWKNTTDVTAKEEANALAEKALRDNINLLLRRGEETGDANLYLQAVNDSRDYLASFPEDVNAASIHWNLALTLDEKAGRHDEAFDEYIKISNLYWDSRFQKPAAENAIAIADEAVRRDTVSASENVMPLTIGEIRENLASEDSLRSKLNMQERELTPDEHRLAYALDNYIRLFPHDAETANILAKGGALYYERRQFRESLKYFKTLIKHFPDSPEIDYARYIVMESYFGRSDYKSSEIVARNLRDLSPDYAARANKRLAESIFLQAKTYADSLEYLKAAEEYRRMVAEAPTAELADLALYNAALEYENAKEYPRAIESYGQMLDNYPQSEHYLNALNNLAFDYRELDDYVNAALTYEKLADLEPDQEKAQSALYNASVSYVQAEEWRHAIKANNEFVERFPDSEDADNLLFDNASYYLKLDDIDHANDIYAEFANKFPQSPRVVEAFFHRGAYFMASNRPDLARSEFEKAVTKSNELKNLDLDANEYYAAEALFLETEIKYNEFIQIEFKLPPEKLAVNKDRKKKLLLDIVDSYTKVAGYGTIRVYESTYKIALAYEDFAESWVEQDIPETDENRRIVAKKEINETGAELYERALDAYKNGVKVLVPLAERQRESVKPDTVATTDTRIAFEDTTLIVADRWISKCKEKVSETLYDMAQINFESVRALLDAPPPPGITRLEELVYRNQVIVKAVNPLIDQIVAAHARNIEEGAELGLDNQWIDLSESKLISTSNIPPDEFSALAHECLVEYDNLSKRYVTMIDNQDEAAFDIADQMANILDFGESYATTSIKGYKHTIQKARTLGVTTPEFAGTEETFLKFSLDFVQEAKLHAEQAQSKKKHYEVLFQETDQVDYEDAMFNYDDNYIFIADANQAVLKLAYETGQELNVDNPYMYEVAMALVRLNPEENAALLDLQVESKRITTSAEWLASDQLFDNWVEVDFVDTLWSHAQTIEGDSSGMTQKIWLKLESTHAMDSTASQAAVTEGLVEGSEETASPSPERVYFRKKFMVEGLPVSGIVQLDVDDSFRLYFNGKSVAKFDFDASQTETTHVHDISSLLQTGENLIAVEAWDTDQTGGSLDAVIAVKHLPGWNRIQGRLQGGPETNALKSDESSETKQEDQNTDENEDDQ